MNLDLGANYRLLDKVGGGATGIVWRAIDKRTNQQVAAKILREEHAEDKDLVARFIQERSILTSLTGPPIVQTLDLVVEGSRLAIIMEFVEGQSLRGQLRSTPTLRPLDAVTVATHVLQALEISHGQNVVHRDVKPDNVLLTSDWLRGRAGSIKLTDFGISRLIADGGGSTTSMVGTPEYLAPELIERGEASFAADAYGVGIMLYEMLAGRTPFAGAGTDYAIIHRHVTSAVPPINVPEPLGEILDGLLEKRPHLRMGVAEALAELRAMRRGLRDLPALPPAIAPDSFAESHGPMTVLRPGAAPVAEESVVPVAAVDEPSAYAIQPPDLGIASHDTVLRVASQPSLSVDGDDEDIEGSSGVRRSIKRLPWKVIAAVLGAIVGVVGVVVIGIWVFNRDDGGPTEPVEASVEGEPAASGLEIDRHAVYDPEAGQIELTVAYSTGMNPAAAGVELSGPFFEVVEFDGQCPEVVWDTPGQERNVAATTFIDHTCGWALDPGPVLAGEAVAVKGLIDVEEHLDAEMLTQWLEGNAQTTAATLTDPSTVSSAYPAQRLQDVQAETASRARAGEAVTVTLLPVWPSGVDELNPIYVTPHRGSLTTVFEKVAGDESNIRFVDGCSGAVAVSRDGLLLTAVRPATRCEVHVQVGNFGNISTNMFDVVGHES